MQYLENKIYFRKIELTHIRLEKLTTKSENVKFLIVLHPTLNRCLKINTGT